MSSRGIFPLSVSPRIRRILDTKILAQKYSTERSLKNVLGFKPTYSMNSTCIVICTLSKTCTSVLDSAENQFSRPLLSLNSAQFCTYCPTTHACAVQTSKHRPFYCNTKTWTNLKASTKGSYTSRFWRLLSCGLLYNELFSRHAWSTKSINLAISQKLRESIPSVLMIHY